MATAESFIIRAFSKAGILTAETSLEASELQAGLDQINDMLVSWEFSGVQLGFEPVADKDDELRVPRFAHGAIKSNLAVLLGPEFSKPPSAILMAEAKVTFDNLLNAIIKIGPVEFPSTLPLGAGNECGNYITDRRFFPENDQEHF
jgi:hypothetical protein